LLTEFSYHQKRAWRLAPSGPKFTRNDYDSAIRCTGQLQHTLGEAKNASMERTHTPVCFQVALSSSKTSSRSSVTTKNGLGASHRVDPSSPETTTIVQSDVRGSSSTPWERLRTEAWSARTPQCAFKSPSPFKKLAHGAQLPPKTGLAPRTEWTQVHQKRLRWCNQMYGAAPAHPGRG